MDHAPNELPQASAPLVLFLLDHIIHIMASTPIPVAVIGFGSSARTFHLPLLLSNPAFALHTIQQRPGSTSGPPAHSAFPDAYIAPSLEAVLEGPKALPKPGLVVITTANATHVDFAKKALNAGLHVVVEKPVALTLEDAKALQSLAAEKGLICTAFQSEWLCLTVFVVNVGGRLTPRLLQIAAWTTTS